MAQQAEPLRIAQGVISEWVAWEPGRTTSALTGGPLPPSVDSTSLGNRAKPPIRYVCPMNDEETYPNPTLEEVQT
jgi:hypothetical protein